MLHRELFAGYLEAVSAGKNSTFKALAARVPKELSYVVDGKELSARELLLTKDIEGADLVATEFYNTVLEGARDAVCARNAVPVFKMNTDVMNVPYGSEATYVTTPVAEGAEIPVAVDSYSKVTFTALKYGTRPLITRELVEDSKYDVIAMNVARSGFAMEQGMNQLMFRELYTTISSQTDGDCGNSGANMLKAISDARYVIDAAGYAADTIVMEPKLAADLAASLAGTGTYAQGVAQDMLNGGRVGKILGLNAFVSNHSPASAADWRFTTDNDHGAYVFDSKKIGGIGMRQDLRVENYSDPIRDLVGCAITMRYDVQGFLAAAGTGVIF